MDRFRAQLSSKLKTIAPQMKKLAQETYTKIKDLPVQVQDQLTMSFRVNDHNDLIQITPSLYWMTFPTNTKVQSLSKQLNTEFGNNYYVWNVSEHEYPSEWFQNQVASHVHRGYPCPSLLDIFTICKNILSWLASDTMNVAIINCQSTKGRSILILSILLALQTRTNPAEALLTVAATTNVRDYHALFPSQHLYLTYVENVLNGLKPNSTPLRLVSVIISQIPKRKTPMKFAPYLQLFRDGKIFYNSLHNKEIQRYEQQDNSVLFQIGGIELHDDILMRCKHFENNEERGSFFRVMFNTGFIYNNVLRFSERELDMSSEFLVGPDFFIDLIFERGFQKSSQKIWQNDGRDSTTVESRATSGSSTELVLAQAKACQQIVETTPSLQIKVETQQTNNPQQQQKEEVKVIEITISATNQAQPPVEEQKAPIDEYPILTDEHEEDSSESASLGEHKLLMEQILDSDNKDQDLDDEADDYISTLTKDI